MGQEHSQRNRWVIVSVDPELRFELRGQRQPDGGVESDKPPNISSQSTPGSSAPSLQWVGGGADTLRFRDSFVSKHSLHDVRPQGDLLERLRERDPTLGRGPRVSFSWGDTEITGYVSQCKVRRVGLWRGTGLPRAIAFDIQITAEQDVQPEVSDQANALTGETQFLVLAAGETFETLGARYLGGPLAGELIRRINPSLSRDPEAAGDLVRVYEREHPDMRGRVTPQAVPFLDDLDTGEPAAQLEAIAIDRMTDTRGLDYDQLPEVLAGLV